MTRQRRSRRSLTADIPLDVVGALLILYTVWGSTYLAIKFAVEQMPPYLMLAVRFVAAGGLLYGVMRLRGVRNPRANEWWGSATVGALLLVTGMGSVGLAQSFGAPSGLAAVMVGTMPLWLTLFLRLQGERASRSDYVAMGLGMLGVVLLNLDGGMRGNPTATLLLIVSPVSWALGSALSRRLPQAAGGMGSAVQMLAAGALFVPLGLVRGEQITAWPSVSGWLALLYLVFFGSLVGFSAYVHLLNKHVRPALMTSYAYVNPVVAVLLGMVFAGERFGGSAVAGMAMVVLSVLLVVRPTRKR